MLIIESKSCLTNQPLLSLPGHSQETSESGKEMQQIQDSSMNSQIQPLLCPRGSTVCPIPFASYNSICLAKKIGNNFIKH